MVEKKNKFPFYGYVGLLIIALGEVLLFLRFFVIPVYFTPLEWSGYILFLDGLNWKFRSASLIRSRTREFILMLPWSVICWLVFELYNVYMQNWTYIGLPQNIVARLIGYAWSFATIFPAILETADLLEPLFGRFTMRPKKISRSILYVIIWSGFLFLTVPLFFPESTAKYLMAFIWVGFAFLLEPVNYLLDGRSLFRFFEAGELKQVLSLLLSGLVCGFLWEFWNYWADAKWIYKLPFSWSGPRIFEMPLLGFLGFIPFAVEVHAMQNYLLVLLGRKKTLAPSFST